MAKSMTFKQATERLEEIATELSSNRVELEQSLKLYEESVKLIKLCNDKLKKTQLKIEQLDALEEEEVE